MVNENENVGRRTRGQLIEGTGSVVEVFAQCGKLLPDGKDPKNRANYYEIDLFDLQYGGQELNVNDLTSVLFPQARVFYTADLNPPAGEMRGGFGRLLPEDGRRPAPRVIDLVRLDYPDLSAEVPRRVKWLEEDCGTVLVVNDDHGFVKSERWGKMRFERKALVLTDNSQSSQPLRSLVIPHRTVYFRCYSPPPNHSNWVATSVAPLGEIFEGEGVVMEVKDGCAFVVSPAFGRIYMSYGSLKLKRPHIPWKSKIFKELRGLKVRFKITDSLPGQRCRWRAITVWPK